MRFYIIIQEYMVLKKMDENSCEDSKSVENVVDEQKPKEVDDPFPLEDVNVNTRLDNLNKNQVSDRCGSSYDASVSGTSTGFSPLIAETPPEVIPSPDNKTTQGEIVETAPLLPVYEESDRSRMPAFVEENLSTRKGSVGPPPSYSFVMKQKKKGKMSTMIGPVIADRPPPPAYGNNGGLYVTPEESRFERVVNLPSFGEPIWRSYSQPAFCTRCGVLILTTTHSHDSLATHLAALALCLFGCWPCCLLPYCMNVCKNTYHHCPICQAFLGVYTPW